MQKGHTCDEGRMIDEMTVCESKSRYDKEEGKKGKR